jgi:hypothetical protein
MSEVRVPDRSLDAYWGPAQVRLYMDGFWIDDACAIQYEIQDTKTPKYGYFDRFFRAVSQGPTIVSGLLAINFRFNGYLRSVMEKQIRRRSDFQALTDLSYGLPRNSGKSISNLLTLSDAARLEALSAMAQGYPEDMRNKKFQIMKNKIWGPDSRDEFDRLNDQSSENLDAMTQPEIQERIEERSYQRPGLFTSGFDIMIVYGTDPLNSKDPGLIRVIQQIHLVGESQRIEIDVPDGGRAIREVYRFFARDVRAGEPTGAVPLAGGAAVK